MIFTIALFSGCGKECSNNTSGTIQNCSEGERLTVLDPNSPDLIQYVPRTDSSLLYGNAQAIKSVPDKGEIRWIANNRVFVFPESRYLSFENYADTSHYNLEFWAYLREVIRLRLVNFQLGKHEIYNEETNKKTPEVNYGYYLLYEDDVNRGKWEIDELQDNYVYITNITSAKIAEGEFLLHFKKNIKFNSDPQFSNEINFRCGKFKVKIPE